MSHTVTIVEFLVVLKRHSRQCFKPNSKLVMFILCAIMYVSALAHWAVLVHISVGGYNALYQSMNDIVLYVGSSDSAVLQWPTHVSSTGLSISTCGLPVMVTVNVRHDC